MWEYSPFHARRASLRYRIFNQLKENYDLELTEKHDPLLRIGNVPARNRPELTSERDGAGTSKTSEPAGNPVWGEGVVVNGVLLFSLFQGMGIVF